MKQLILMGIVFWAVYGYAENVYAEEPEIADSLDYPLSDYNPGSFNSRVFGCCWPRHLGEDDKRDPKTPVRAIGNGKIVTGIVSGAHTCFGMVVVIEHTLLDGSKITSIYGHMSNRDGLKPKLSGVVKKGDVIGYVGHSGGKPPYGEPKWCGQYLDDENGDGGPHLHFGIRKGEAPKKEDGQYAWVYYGYSGTHGEDVDYDAKNNYIGGKFMSGKVFIDKYNAKYPDSNRDRDQDGFTVAEGDCDDANPNIYPGAPEKCNGLDDNCDRQIDEDWKIGLASDLGNSCQVKRGLCQEEGVMVCSADGRATVCSAQITPTPEVCDGLDNNCDGRIDEDISGLGEKCVVGEGACQQEGVAVCLPEANPPGLYCSVAPLEPDCPGKQCGPDGCGGSCGECLQGQFCNAQFQCQLIGANCPADKDCANLECGPDPICGESCGGCDANEKCKSGKCYCKFEECGGICCNDGQVCGGNGSCCAPDCSGKQCGDDGCGGSCGSCLNPPADYCQSSSVLREYTGNSTCSSGTCVWEYTDQTCVYGCSNGSCGGCAAKTCAELGKQCDSWSDGCGGLVDCGSCGTNQYCSSGVCKCSYLTCDTVCCASGQVCYENACCTKDTCEGLSKQCGSWPNGCGGTVSCGSCGLYETCNNGACECQYAECGGKCCSSSQSCANNVCAAPYELIHSWGNYDYSQGVKWFGYSVSMASDVDGDGVNDILVGAPESGTGDGKVFLFSGYSGGLLKKWVSDDFNSWLGSSVSLGGDVDGDGMGDILIGQSNYDGYYDQAGAVLLYSSALFGEIRFWEGGGKNYYLGYSVSLGGDIDGDGRADVLIGESGYNNKRGRARVYSGGAGSLLYTFYGDPQDGAEFGASVAFGPDADGDGKDDILIGQPFWGVTSIRDNGKAYLYSSADGSLIRSWQSPTDEDQLFGKSVSLGPDADGDGLADVLIGAPGKDNTVDGSVYLYSSATGNLIRGYHSFHEHFGESVSLGPDVDGDGLADILIGDTNVVDSDGKAYLYSSASGVYLKMWSGVDCDFDFGKAVVLGGDINGDGYPDALIGAPRSSCYGSGRVVLYTTYH